MTADGPSLERAIADYLAHSRAHDIYADEEAYARADEAWWDRLMWALAREMAPVLEAGTDD